MKLEKVPVIGFIAKTIWNAAIEFATEQRGWFVVIFVLPFSALFDIFFKVRGWIIMKMFSAPALHDRRVKEISDTIKQIRASGNTGKLVTARGGWQSTSLGNRPYKKHAQTVSLNLYDILELDTENNTVRVEPYVSMGQISSFLEPRNLRLPITPELDDLTAGGLMMGVGIETSSHQCGLFDDTVVACEVILADGSVVNCSKTENRELFDALPWSYGTLGFLASLTIKVIPSKPFVRIEYIPCHSREEGVKVFTKYAEAENAPDFLEALQYSSENSVVMPASLVDADQVSWAQQNTISLWYKPWFYKHVEKFLSMPASGTYVEYIPTRDYFHRHTKPIFWEMEDIIPFGNSPWFRYLLGWYLPIKVSFLKLTQTPQIKKMYEEMHMVQDMLLPINKLGDAIGKFDEVYGSYPLWLCPYRAYDHTDKEKNLEHRHFLRKPKNIDPSKGYEMFVDIGVYGTPLAVKEKRPYNNFNAHRALEDYVLKNDGFQMMYATSFLTREEFRQMFDHTHYDNMKKKYDPHGAFPRIYEKTCKNGMDSFQKLEKERKNRIANPQ